ncbi:TadE/TadG family type IV pilus assembly protein [Wenxinia marina]|nr:TadE/TadG family type IV pilus assembly protein [Wenxinia marina]GGL68316.1 hypothetical protein GCM10011392_23540 [Wenxinia marina]
MSRRSPKKFFSDDDGSSTVEAVLWVPMLAMLLILITDVSFIFYGRAETMRIVQDANRAFSVGRLADEAETMAFIRSALSGLSPNAEVETTLELGVIRSRVLLPIDDLMAVGTIPGLTGFDVSVMSQHLLES